MSWLARSLAISLRLGDDEHDNDSHYNNFDTENDAASSINNDFSTTKRNEEETDSSNSVHENEEQTESLQARGVKEDLNEFKQTLTRQIGGVASFLAPPPPPPRLPPPPPQQKPFNVKLEISRLDTAGDRSRDSSDGEEPEMSVIRNVFEDIGGRFRGGETDMSRTASGYVHYRSDENEGSGSEKETERDEFYDWRAAAVGLTDEVLAFARNIAMHPETWLDFPLDEEDDLEDFNMSDAQREHALAIEQLAPRLAALRIELCPCHMSEGYFWKVYFVLLHSRLNKQDAEALSTTQVMEARALWMQEQTKSDCDWFGTSTSYSRENCTTSLDDYGHSRTFDYDQTTSSTGEYCEAEKYPDVHTELEFFDKSVIVEKPLIRVERSNEIAIGSPSLNIPTLEFDDDDDDWPDVEDSDLGDFQSKITPGNEEDISFSDLEDDDDLMPINSKILIKRSKSSAPENLRFY